LAGHLTRRAAAWFNQMIQPTLNGETDR
jgi:hypothetical protein